MKLSQRLIVEPGKKAGIDKRDPEATPGIRGKKQAQQILERNVRRLAELQYLLYAQNKYAVLVVFQAMDAGGKDGLIRHVMTGLNPQGCGVTPFKVPSSEEADHDFLWRVHNAVPRKGEIGIFNRSHYEDVLIVRVHDMVPKQVWSQRYGQINQFENILWQNNTIIVKFYLHISKQEQLKRLRERLKDPTKHWKASAKDFEERKRWKDYMAAYEDALTRCSTDWAPWYVVPANNKWYRNIAVSQIIVERLEALEMRYPPPNPDVAKLLRQHGNR